MGDMDLAARARVQRRVTVQCILTITDMDMDLAARARVQRRVMVQCILTITTMDMEYQAKVRVQSQDMDMGMDHQFMLGQRTRKLQRASRKKGPTEYMEKHKEVIDIAEGN